MRNIYCETLKWDKCKDHRYRKYRNILYNHFYNSYRIKSSGRNFINFKVNLLLNFTRNIINFHLLLYHTHLNCMLTICLRFSIMQATTQIQEYQAREQNVHMQQSWINACEYLLLTLTNTQLSLLSPLRSFILTPDSILILPIFNVINIYQNMFRTVQMKSMQKGTYERGLFGEKRCHAFPIICK